MEIRNIQRTGGSSYTVTLPKQWIAQWKLQDKDPLSITLQSNGALIVRPGSSASTLKPAHIQIRPFSCEHIKRELIGHYLSGINEVVIQHTNITHEERNCIRECIKFLIGFEIVDESSRHTIIKNIFDISKFPIVQNIQNIFRMASSMYVDSVQAILESDFTLAGDVTNRDSEVDKLCFAIQRQFCAVMTGKINETETELDLLHLYFYDFVANQVERIADHAVKIAKSADRLSMPSKKDEKTFYGRLIKDREQISALIRHSAQMVLSFDKTVAHEILDTNADIDNSRSDNNSYGMPLLEDSLDRIRRYIFNIAEMTIDYSILMKSA